MGLNNVKKNRRFGTGGRSLALDLHAAAVTVWKVVIWNQLGPDPPFYQCDPRVGGGHLQGRVCTTVSDCASLLH